MIDIRLVRENPDLVRENMKKKFQEEKLPLVDEVIELDKLNRAAISEASDLRAQRNSLSKQIGKLMGMAKKDPSKLDEVEAIKAQVNAQAERLAELERDVAVSFWEKVDDTHTAVRFATSWATRMEDVEALIKLL